jgi:hypothetical protein
MRSSQKETESRQSPIFAASFQVMVMALIFGTCCLDKARVARISA